MGSSCAGCGSGAHAPQSSNNEPMEVHQAQETLGPTWEVAESVDLVQPEMLVPIADVPEHWRQFELQLVYRPETDSFEYMVRMARPVPAAPATDDFLTWLQERVDYGEP